jgi:membrane-bound lytic murein transglycosylase B
MYNTASGRWLAIAGLVCACAGCSSKSPEEVEAERAKANAEWNIQEAGAERVRQEEEKKLVSQQVAEHDRQVQIDDEREQRAEQQNDTDEQARLLALVQAKYAEPGAVRFTNVHWNTTKAALCGEVSAPTGQGSSSGFVHFIVNGDEPVVDGTSEEDHARFSAAAQSIDCSQ